MMQDVAHLGQDRRVDPIPPGEDTCKSAHRRLGDLPFLVIMTARAQPLSRPYNMTGHRWLAGR